MIMGCVPQGPRSVQVLAVSLQPFETTFQALGKVQPSRDVRIVSPTSARIVRLYARVGQTVQAGDPLVRLVDMSGDVSLLRAPFDGVVAEQFSDAFDWATSLVPIVRLIQVTPTHIHVGVHASDYARLVRSAPAKVELGDRVVSAEIESLSPLRDSSGLYPVTLRLESEAVSLGTVVRVEFVADRSFKATVIPEDAIVGGQKVAIVDALQRVVYRDVSIESTHEGLAHVQGLIPGDRVVVSHHFRLKPGEKIVVE